MRVQVKKLDRVNPLRVADVVRRSPAATAPDGVSVLTQWIDRSVITWEGTVDGVVACMFGLVAPTVLSEQAYLWLITTELVDDHKFVFIRYSQRLVEMMLEEFPLIVGDVLVGQYRAYRWLKWLGATFGPSDGKKIPFQIRAKNG